MLDPGSNRELPPIPAKRYFTIGEVSELCDVKPHVLRYWETEFPTLNPVKRRGNRRYYQRHEVLMVRQIRGLLYEQGYTIGGARLRLDGEGAKQESALSSQIVKQVRMELEEVLQLLDDLRAQCRLLLRPLAVQAQARPADGVALLVQQATDLANHQHVVALVIAAVAAALDRLERRKFGFPVAQHVRLDVAQLADLTDGEVALGRDRRQFLVAPGIKHGRPPRRRPRPAP